ncbi:NHL repeat-containing protein [Brumimicrobium aurantiacum]|uniref:Bulb-type lectin domain-containing protein n=1 Tax=Brumimicrobium aurantiacum TaxID=1737063 RepID=A0A3E1EVG0_9FLAO|nr:hypothetical protein [Brumimicrobium aurantiacum]RFC53545.1 hypothetical protein DXU93_12330 [Brumimicrobium aurantiacum]
MFSVNQLFGQNQIYFSENWMEEGGEATLFYKNTTATDGLGHVYMAGSSIILSGNHDIILQKFDPDGNLHWEQTFNGAANMDDFAADLFVDDDNNVFVTDTAIDDI